MKFNSALLTEASGSLGGIVASHNAGGAYFRKRVVPTNPNSIFQVSVRSTLAALANAWNNVLTADQRDSWKAYSDNVPLRDTLGAARTVGALAMYVRSNTPRINAGLLRIDDAPTVYNIGVFSPCTVTESTTSGSIDLSFENSDDWATAVGGALIIQTSRAQNPTINFFKGPFLFTTRVLGAVSPPTSPFTFVPGFPWTSGQRVFVRLQAVTADGRLAQPQVLFCDAA